MNLDYNYNYTASHVKIAQVAPPGGDPAGGGAPAPALDGAPATRPLAAGGWRSREAATPPGAAIPLASLAAKPPVDEARPLDPR